MTPGALTIPDRTHRVDWVDYGRGLCIILVVMMHSTLGVGEAMGREGWLHAVVEWARPFRIPSFFLIAGLFLHRSLDSDWLSFLDRKVVHFVYFYLLWMVIQCLLKCWPKDEAMFPAGALDVARDMALHLVQPIGTLWFIYVLPIFYVATRLLRNVSPLAVFAVAAGAQALHLDTGWVTLDEVTGRYVYFYVGYALHQHVFGLAGAARRNAPVALGLILAWALTNALAVTAGVSLVPGLSLALGLAGAAALVATSALLAEKGMLAPIRFAGQHSIVIYLAFFIPMVAARIALVRLGIISDVGLISLAVTAFALIAPWPMAVIADRIGAGFLFRRPERFALTKATVARDS